MSCGCEWVKPACRRPLDGRVRRLLDHEMVGHGVKEDKPPALQSGGFDAQQLAAMGNERS